MRGSRFMLHLVPPVPNGPQGSGGKSAKLGSHRPAERATELAEKQRRTDHDRS